MPHARGGLDIRSVRMYATHLIKPTAVSPLLWTSSLVFSFIYLSVVQSMIDVSSHLDPMRVVCLHTCQQSVKSRVSELTVRVVKLYAASIAYITYMVHGNILPDKPHAVADNGKITYTMMTNLPA